MRVRKSFKNPKTAMDEGKECVNIDDQRRYLTTVAVVETVTSVEQVKGTRSLNPKKRVVVVVMTAMSDKTIVAKQRTEEREDLTARRSIYLI